MIHRTVGHYEILGQLGAGGMGVVHLARDSRLNRKVALKVLPDELASSPEARQRLTREAQSASALNSPNIVTIFEIGSDGGSDFIAMEYIQGETLTEVLRRGMSGIETSVAYAVQISSALAAAHREGIVHRDIKPGNVMVTQDGLIKVLDFGLAKPATGGGAGSNQAETATTPLTQMGVAVGTLSYMSPEQALGESVDARTDVFSFGIVLYEMFTGRVPFSGATPGETFRRLQLEDPPRPSTLRAGVPAELDGIILKALAKSREDRYPSCIELESDLRLLQSGSKSNFSFGQFPDSPASAIGPALVRKFKSRKALQIGFGVLAAAAMAVWQPWQARPHEPSPPAQRWFDQGTAAIRDGTYHTASLALERAISSDPQFSLAHIRLAEAYFELDALDRAKEELLRAVPSDSGAGLSSLEELHLQAVRLTLTADFEGAAQKYAEIRDAVPAVEKPSALVDYGRALELAGNLKGAMAAYEEASRLQSQYPAAFLRLGVLHRRRLDQTQAGAAFQQAEGLYRSLGNIEGTTEVNYQRGVLLNSLGNPREAGTILDNALETARAAENPQQQIAILLQLSSVLHRLNQSSEARERATAAIRLARAKGLEPLAARGLIDLGNAYFVDGDAEEARNYFNQAVETARRTRSRRTEARALLSLGSLDIQYGRMPDGLKNVEAALTFYRQGGYRKETSQGLLLAGRARRSLGDYEGAHKTFEEQHRRAVEVGDIEQSALSLEAMGSVHLLQGRLTEALADFQAALAAGGNTANSMASTYIRLNSATALARLGRYAESEKLLAGIEPTKPDAKSGGAVGTRAAQVRAMIAMSRNQFASACAGLGRLLASGGLKGASATEIKAMLADAQAQSGNVAGALQVSRAAVDESVALGLPDLAAAALAARAVAQFHAGQFDHAVESATAAHEKLAAAGDHERAWRNLLVAARASASAGKKADAARFAGLSADQLAALQKTLGPADFAVYLRRPDVQFDHGQLDRGLLRPVRNAAPSLLPVKGSTK